MTKVVRPRLVDDAFFARKLAADAEGDDIELMLPKLGKRAPDKDSGAGGLRFRSDAPKSDMDVGIAAGEVVTPSSVSSSSSAQSCDDTGTAPGSRPGRDELCIMDWAACCACLVRRPKDEGYASGSWFTASEAFAASCSALAGS